MALVAITCFLINAWLKRWLFAGEGHKTQSSIGLGSTGLFGTSIAQHPLPLSLAPGVPWALSQWDPTMISSGFFAP